MSVATKVKKQQYISGKLKKTAVSLLSQQTWCWGQDILRPEGNWLLELGFQRREAPVDRENCSSVYTLELPQGRRVVLRGFGIFYGDDSLGGVFLPRFEFGPKYTTHSTLTRPPWSQDELPELNAPSASQREACGSLTLALIDWIVSYELNITEQLGFEYRQSTLDRWQDGKRAIVPAQEIAAAWRSLGIAVTEILKPLLSEN